MDSWKKSNKIREIVRLQQILKRWKKLAVSAYPSPTLPADAGSCNKTINKFLKRTLSFTDDATAVPKGYLAVCVGPELQRFIIPTSYLRHRAFGVLLQEAEEEFGFQQEGVLKIPCEVETFERILTWMEATTKKSWSSESDRLEALNHLGVGGFSDGRAHFADRWCSTDPMTPSRDHFQMCR